MINNYSDLLKVLESVDFGKPVFTIELDNRSIQFKPRPFVGKDALSIQPAWMESTVKWALSRKFDKETKSWVLSPETLNKINKSLQDEVFNVIRKCSGAKAPERTALYKEYRQICDKHSLNDAFYSDLIAVFNYYYSSKTDTTCKSNVIGLLELLRKKYGTGSAGRTSS